MRGAGRGPTGDESDACLADGPKVAPRTEATAEGWVFLPSRGRATRGYGFADSSGRIASASWT
ncbi:hypothetical protein DF3PA_70054 [Candidatus Defluviicoccus seviourii]|uniref:Uncharacterized protein n=2 Tax=root TaxID=1 RepID=A0A564WJG8_9PROT|nr:hypothetical protein DF3PB_1030002 [uncultured Defluviicoccus sp.]VUX47733.1 hypothetical protein DF3PA_70054 [Candidatus Defluviicoccus seviourii]